jgi:hypothetical protein
MKIFAMFSICLFLTVFGCQATDGLTPSIALEDLLDAPVSVSIGGRDFILETFLWRDFMPISPPDGKPLIAIVWTVATDSLAVPSSLECDRIYVILDNELWESALAPPDGSGNGEDYKLERVARDGPKWGPDIAVDVVVRLFYDNEYYFLRVPQQWIYRTD